MKRRMMACALLSGMLLGSAALAAKPAGPKLLQGNVTEVLDGQSLRLQPATGAAVLVRLDGIEAPLSCQEHGEAAKLALQGLVLQQSVTLASASRDAQGHLVATVMLGERNVNRSQVEEGWAFSERVKWDRGPYVKEERVAAALRRGMNATGAPLTPTKFLRTHAPCPAPAAPG